ncbi:MAG: hypothetical protein ACHRHE_09395 [Tepidisphaerales bacterium]
MREQSANSGFIFRVEETSAVAEESPQSVALPPGASRLRFDGERGLGLDPASAGIAEGTVVEPLALRRRSVVLLVTHTGRSPRVNGQPVPRVAVLKENDHLLLDGAAGTLLLVRDATPCIGPAPADFIGHPCPFCRVPFDSGTRVLLCVCGQPLHFADPGAGEDRLECARLAAECPVCGRPIGLPVAGDGGVHHE